MGMTTLRSTYASQTPGITSGTVTWWGTRKVLVAAVYEDDRSDRRIATRVVFLDDGTEGMPFVDELGYKARR